MSLHIKQQRPEKAATSLKKLSSMAIDGKICHYNDGLASHHHLLGSMLMCIFRGSFYFIQVASNQRSEKGQPSQTFTVSVRGGMYTWSTRPWPKAWKKPEDSTVLDRKLKMDLVREATFLSTTLLYARVTPGATGTRYSVVMSSRPDSYV